MTSDTLVQQTPAGWPRILYGTAWKGDATAALVRTALHGGFRAIDTAGQPKHYHEPGVGAGLAAAMDELGLAREDVFVQTKYTPPLGQGRELPYDAAQPARVQVEQSLARSLENLGTDHLDSYLLHAPEGRRGLADVDRERWHALEEAYGRGLVRRIGISNAAPVHLEALAGEARVPPMAVQNRCFARSGWDRDVRAFCAAHGIAYQGFSLLTANPEVLEHAAVRRLAAARDATAAQLVFAFARAVGMIPLTGTTSERHMAHDLDALDLDLDAGALAAVEAAGRR